MVVSKEQFKTIDDYIRNFPEAIQAILETMRHSIREAAPETAEAISYNMPAFRLNGKNLVYFAAFKHHIGFYSVSAGLEEFKEELAPYKQGKGSVQFPIDKPVPYELVKDMVRFQVAERIKKRR
jgi:uncharacterized protein YdhG (YjbR/CyaY superfamily)